MRELCLGMTVASSLPVAGHQTLVRHTPKQQLSGKALGEGVHLIKPAGSASELVSFEKQLENWGSPRHIEGSPKVSVPHLGPDAHPVMSSTSACWRSAALMYVAT